MPRQIAGQRSVKVCTCLCRQAGRSLYVLVWSSRPRQNAGQLSVKVCACLCGQACRQCAFASLLQTCLRLKQLATATLVIAGFKPLRDIHPPSCPMHGFHSAFVGCITTSCLSGVMQGASQGMHHNLCGPQGVHHNCCGVTRGA
eukprot:scaffold258398_cov19-Tisochrysis_lutea.AAC.1